MVRELTPERKAKAIAQLETFTNAISALVFQNIFSDMHSLVEPTPGNDLLVELDVVNDKMKQVLTDLKK